VSVWDLTRGVLACRLGEGQSLKRFTGMAFSADGSRLYTSNAGDGDVLEWGLGTGECRRRLTGDKHGASALVVGPAGSAILAVARTRIHLIDLVSGERRKKISSGHAAAVTHMAFSEDGHFLATASVGSRHINIFSCQGKDKEAVLTAALDGCPTWLALRADPSGREKGAIVLTLLACCDTGSVRVLRQSWAAAHAPPCDSAGSGEDAGALARAGTRAPPTTLRVLTVTDGKESEKVSALAACFLPWAGRKGSIAWRVGLAYGAESAPVFTSFSIASGEETDELLPRVLLEGSRLTSEKGKQEDGLASNKRKRREVKAVEMQDPASKRTALDEHGISGLNNAAGVGAMIEMRGDTEDDDTMGRRLQKMAEGLSQGLEGHGALVAAGPVATAAKSMGSKADSLFTVLSQALKSGDEELLEQCLAVQDTQILSRTVRLLTAPLVFPFINTLVRKLEKRPNRAVSLCPWIRFVLLHHTSYLIGTPGLDQRLAGLHKVATRRVTVLPRLLGLSGRLELMLAQISKHGSGDHTFAPGGDNGDVEVYMDGSSEEEGDEEDVVGDEADADGLEADGAGYGDENSDDS